MERLDPGDELRSEAAVDLQSHRSLERRLYAEVQPPGATVLADAAGVAVRVDAHPLANGPTGDARADGTDAPDGLVAEDVLAGVDLRQLGGVEVAPADAAEVDVEQDLAGPQRRHRSILKLDRAALGEDHRVHVTGLIGHDSPAAAVERLSGCRVRRPHTIRVIR